MQRSATEGLTVASPTLLGGIGIARTRAFEFAGDVTITCVSQRELLTQLEPEWNGLLSRSDVASPFLTPGWQMAWLDTYGKRHRPFVLVARQAGELVGLWPLALRRRGPFKVLEPMGAERSDWLDIPMVPDQRERVLSAFLDYLQEHRGAWDLIELRDVLADSPSLTVLSRLCQEKGVNVRRQPRTVAPYLALTGSWEQFLSSKRGKFRANLKYYRRLAERNGQRVDVHRVPWGDGDAAVETLAAIELKSWKAREGNLKISTPLGREFYRRFCQYLSDCGCLDLWRIDINGATVAFVLNIIYQGKCYHYNTCYDEESAYMSPGMLLHSLAIADAFERRLTEYDFLSGDEPYKERWCSDRRSIDHVSLSHRRPVSRVAQAMLVEARWALRRSKMFNEGRQRVLAAVRRIVRRDSAKHA